MDLLDQDASDDQLLERYRTGHAEAFDTLFARHHGPVYHFARHMLADPAAAQDILQDTFLAVARNAATYASRGHFRTWLMRIARNLCLNRLESQRLRRTDPRPVDMLDPPSAGDQPSRSLEAAEELDVLRRAIAALPPRQREAILLLTTENLTYHQIAEVLDMPINTVKTLIHRARAALALALQNAHGECP